MKIQDIRKGDIYQNISGNQNRTASATNTFQVLRVENSEEDGYEMSAIWLGNISSKKATLLDITQINNKNTWKHHRDAHLEEIVVRRLMIPVADPIELSSFPYKPPTPKQEPKPEPVFTMEEPEVKSTPVKVIPTPSEAAAKIENRYDSFALFASSTYTNFEELCYEFANSVELHMERGRPGKKSGRYIVYETEWSAFKNNQKTIREIRDMKLWISPKNNSGVKYPSFETIIRRLLQSALWFGDKTERGIIKKAHFVPGVRKS